MNKKAFTLVELIVVITILAILWTIAFISLQWYSKDARDSTRISDLNSIKSSLELYKLNTSSFPIPDNKTDVTYSWAIAWYQWTFWDNNTVNVEKLSEKPTDPLTFNEYAYSRTSFWNEYELATVLESWLSYNNISNTVNADWLAIWTAYIIWNYNQKFLRTREWSVDYVLAVPSIISSDLSDATLESIIQNSNLVYNWYNNLPSNYDNTQFNRNPDVWFEFSLTNPLIFTWSVRDLTDVSNQTIFVTNLKSAYSGSILETSNSYDDIISLDLSDEDEITTLVWQYSSNYNWWLPDLKISYWTSSNSDDDDSDLTFLSSMSLTIKDTPVQVWSNLFFLASEWWWSNYNLWISDWTESWTQIVKDIRPWFDPNILHMTVVWSRLYFTANDWTNWQEIWSSDWTESWTNMVSDIRPWLSWSFPYWLKAIWSNLYFWANDWTNWSEPWVTDWTWWWTILLEDTETWSNSGTPTDFVSFNWSVFFISWHPTSPHRQLWTTDWTSDWTSVFKVITTWSSSSSNSYWEFTVLWSNMFFKATDWTNGSELWLSDWTDDGTFMLKDIRPWSSGSFIFDITTLWSNIYFKANDWNWQELWVSDWTNLWTQMVKNINSSSASHISNIEKIWSNIYFWADNSTNWTQLWSSDWTDPWTQMLSSINSPNGTYMTQLYLFNWELFFSAYDWSAYALYKSDWTAPWTVELEFAWNTPNTFFTYGDNLYFFASPGLWDKLFMTDWSSTPVEIDVDKFSWWGGAL